MAVVNINIMICRFNKKNYFQAWKRMKKCNEIF